MVLGFGFHARWMQFYVGINQDPPSELGITRTSEEIVKAKVKAHFIEAVIPMGLWDQPYTTSATFLVFVLPSLLSAFRADLQYNSTVQYNATSLTMSTFGFGPAPSRNG